VTLSDLTLTTRDEAELGLPAVGPTADAACCAPLTRETITAADAETFARRLKALADPVRLRLVSIVAASEGHEACVCDLIEPVG
jgi:ArsR family transcriptional regulator